MKKVTFFPIGGMDEIGKNMYAFDVEGQIFLFDSGYSIPTNEMLGIKKIIPDSAWIIENSKKISGIFISSVHPFNFGAIPYLWKRGLNSKIYTSTFNAFLIKDAFREAEIPEPVITEVESGSVVNFGSVKIGAFWTFSSTPQSLGFVIICEDSSFLYLGDFMFSNDKYSAFKTDFKQALDFCGGKPITAMFMATNNVNKIGYTSPHHKVYPFYEKNFFDFKGRTIAAFYSHEIYHALALLNLAKISKRPVAIYSNNFKRTLDKLVSEQLYSMEGIKLVELSKLSEYENVVVLIVTSVDKLWFWLSRIANEFDDIIKLQPNDKFLLMANHISANELSMRKAIDDVARTNVELIESPASILPIKACQEDIKMAISLFKPSYIIPHSGYYKDLVDFAKPVTESNNDNLKNLFVLHNGEAVSFGKEVQMLSNYIQFHESYIDSEGLTDTSSGLLDDRNTMSQEGAICVSIAIDATKKTVESLPDIQMKGVVFLDQSKQDVFKKMQDEVVRMCHEAMAAPGKFDLKELRMNVQKKILRLSDRNFNKKPVVIATILNV